MLHAHSERFFVASYKEIAGLFVAFGIVLVILYPYDTLQKQVLNESSNYDLTAAYLSNMLKNDPKNEKMLLALVHTVQKTGNVDLGLTLIETLKKSSNPHLREEVDALRYMLLKDKLAQSPDNERLKKDLRARLHHIVKTSQYLEMADLQTWYSEALFLKENTLALELAQKALKEEEDNLDWLSEVYALAGLLDKETLKNDTLTLILKYDHNNSKYWNEEAYYDAFNKKKYDKASKYLKKLEKISSIWKIQHAQLAIDMQQYKEASRLYFELYEDEDEAKLKKQWILKSIQSLEYGGHMKEAVVVAKSVEKMYLQDKEMIHRFLKLYLAANDLESASSLAQYLLKVENQNEDKK